MSRAPVVVGSSQNNGTRSKVPKSEQASKAHSTASNASKKIPPKPRKIDDEEEEARFKANKPRVPSKRRNAVEQEEDDMDEDSDERKRVGSEGATKKNVKPRKIDDEEEEARFKANKPSVSSKRRNAVEQEEDDMDEGSDERKRVGSEGALKKNVKPRKIVSSKRRNAVEQEEDDMDEDSDYEGRPKLKSSSDERKRVGSEGASKKNVVDSNLKSNVSKKNTSAKGFVEEDDYEDESEDDMDEDSDYEGRPNLKSSSNKRKVALGGASKKKVPSSKKLDGDSNDENDMDSDSNDEKPITKSDSKKPMEPTKFSTLGREIDGVDDWTSSDDSDGDKRQKRMSNKNTPDDADDDDADDDDADDDDDASESSPSELQRLADSTNQFKNLPLGELVKLRATGIRGQPLKLNSLKASNVQEIIQKPQPPPKKKEKRKKEQPREVSSKHQVSRNRDVVPIARKVTKDPRFTHDEVNMPLHRHRFEFLEKVRDEEIDTVRTQVKRELFAREVGGRKGRRLKRMNEDQLAEERARLTRLEQHRAETNRSKQVRDRLVDLKRQERAKLGGDAAKQVFLDSKTKKQVALQVRYEDLVNKNKLDEYMKKRQRKNEVTEAKKEERGPKGPKLGV